MKILALSRDSPKVVADTESVTDGAARPSGLGAVFFEQVMLADWRRFDALSLSEP